MTAYGPKEAWAILRFDVGLRGMASASQRLPDGVHILLRIGAPYGPRVQDAPSPKSPSQVILALIHNQGERLEKPLIFQ